MGPVTRSSVNGRPTLEGPKKSIEAQFTEHSSEQSSWELAVPASGQNRRAVSESLSFDGSYQEDETLGSYDDGDNDENMPPSHLTPDDHEDILHPLRDAANRVGREVEEFARALDRFNPLKAINKAENHAMSFELLDQYQSISAKTVQRLQDRHRAGKKSRSKFRGFQLENQIEEVDMDREEPYYGDTTPDDLERWEQEANTWDLLSRLFTLKHRNNREEPAPLNRFSPERDYWNSFLNSDNLAAERATVLDWLKSIAEDEREDVDVLVHDLQHQAERGDIINNGWLYTKLAVKNTKRNASLSNVIDPKNPLVKEVHLNNKKTEVLITQLDPDAPCRQKLKLEPEDVYFERAIWLGCYEMLRRGTSRQKIREWCEERAEIWRAVSMSGLPSSNDEARDEASNQTSISLWRRTCYASATRPGAEIYEKAVYGILSGDLASVEAVCKNWDDLIFAHYNSLLVSQFEHFLRDANPDRANADALQSFRFFDAVQYHGEPTGVAQRLITSLKEHPKASVEAKQPMKMIQAILIANEFDMFIEEQGLMLANMANSGIKESVLFPKQPLPEWLDPTKAEDFISMNDYDSLRVLTHTLLAFKSFGLDYGDDDRLAAIENVVVAYINFLRLAGKEELIPLYAAQLSEDRMYAVLGRTLIDVLQPAQRETLIRLMQDLGIDVQRFVKWQTRCLMRDYFVAPDGYPAMDTIQIVADVLVGPTKILEQRVLPNFTRCEVDRIYLLLIRSLEWYLLVDGLWVETFEAGAELYKLFFRVGNLGAADLLSSSIPSSLISQSKSGLICGESLDLESLESFLQDEELMGDHEVLAESRSKRRLLQYMLDSATCFKELEMLQIALGAMDDFAITVQNFESNHENRSKSTIGQWRRDLNQRLNKARATVEPLLHGWLLKSQESDPQLHTLRLVYLPDVVLGLNWILNFGGYLLTRGTLLASMDLVTVVADEENKLTELFFESGKIRELVESFAKSSQLVLQSAEGNTASKGQTAKQLRREKGMNFKLWSVDFERQRGADASD